MWCGEGKINMMRGAGKKIWWGVGGEEIWWGRECDEGGKRRQNVMVMVRIVFAIARFADIADIAARARSLHVIPARFS